MSGLVKNNNGLPEGWNIVTLNNICEINPRLDKLKFPADMEVSFVPMAAVGASDGKIDVSQKRPFYEVKKGFTSFQSGDVLFAKITPCMENGKMAVVPKLVNECGFGSTEFHVLRPNHGTDARYIYYYVSCENFRREAAHNMTGAVGQKRVSASYLSEQKIPLAPLDQQKLIVSEIEKQFSRLDEAVAALKRVRASLKRYKASVLKAAVEGKMTEEWRKENSLESQFPWKKVQLKYVTTKVGSGATPRGGKHSYKKEGIPLIRSMNVHFPRFQYNGLAFIDKEQTKQLDNVAVEEGDVLLNITGASIGRVTLAPKTMKGARVNQHVCIIRTTSELDSDFLSIYLASPKKQQVINKIQVGATRQALTKAMILNFEIPFPAISEQRNIVDKVKQHISIIEHLEDVLTIQQGRAERLRQAILKKAFEGKLI